MPEPLVNDAAREDASGDDRLGPTVILPPVESAATAQAGSIGPGLAPAGWFGKLPMLGDFASRRLPEAFIRPWDDWLQPSLAATRQAIGERWLDLYLTFPVWRFVVPAGLLGDVGWVGVFLPSVDRVGRCFPLTICEPVARDMLEAAGLACIDAHLSPLAEAGIDALDAGTVDLLEQRLATLAQLQADATRTPGRTVALEAWLPARHRISQGHCETESAWPLQDPIAATLSAAASRFVIATLGNRVLWWSRGALRLEPYPFSGGLLGNLIGTD